MKHYSPLGKKAKPAKRRRRPARSKPTLDETVAAIFNTITDAIKLGRKRAEHHGVARIKLSSTSIKQDGKNRWVPCVAVDLRSETGGGKAEIFECDGNLYCWVIAYETVMGWANRPDDLPFLVETPLCDSTCFEVLAKRLALRGIPFELEAERD